MGIPHLTTFLRPYAESEPLTGRNAVIDGPGLAYHVYHICMSNSRPSDRNAFEAAPSYFEIGIAVIEWLDGLQRSGVIIKKIYFDGYLPSSKLDVRIERLRKQTKRLNDYYETNAVPCRAPSITLEARGKSVFNIKPVRASLTTLSPPALLVPAVLDALHGSTTYQTLTEGVPGEADLYCAAYLHQHGGVVFTGDSDLLVYDLGSRGAVCFFNDVATSADADSDTLSSHIYMPSTIALRLALPEPHGLRALAFEILMDNQGTFRKLLGQAVSQKAIDTKKGKYKEFCTEYDKALDVKVSEVGEKVEHSGFLEALRGLDPRTSEYVLQFPKLAGTAGLEILDTDSRHVFLPFLLDCPVRRSAWEMSTAVRQLAYSLTNLIVPTGQRRSSTFEHRKQQKNSNAKGWQLPSLPDIPEGCTALLELVEELAANLPDISSQDLWTSVFVYQDVEYSFSHDKLPLTDLVLRQLFSLKDKVKGPRNYTWDIVQFFAHVEGSYYSFRMLKQITGLIVAYGPRDLAPALYLLHDRLKTLPSLELYEPLNGPHLSGKLYGIAAMLKAAREILGIEDQKSHGGSGSSKKS